MAKKTYFQLYDVANDYSLSPVPGKYQFGDLEHAKKAAQKLINDWVKGMKSKPVGPNIDYKIRWRRAATSGTRPDAIMEWNGDIHKGELVYKIIEREKTFEQKEFEKRQAKLPPSKRVRKNPGGFILATYAPVYDQVVFVTNSKGDPMVFAKSKAKAWKTENGASAAAVRIEKSWGEPVIVFPQSATPSQIKAAFPGARISQNPKGRKVIKQGMQLPGGRGRVMQYDSATDYVLVDRGAGYQPFVVWTIDPKSLDTYTGHYFKNLGDAVRKFEEKTGREMNPTSKGKKKMARKKKRSAKQLANDKRLGRMAKKRAAARRKNPGKKKAKKKAAKRRRNPAAKQKDHLWLVFKCRGKAVWFVRGDGNSKLGWTQDKGRAVLFQTIADAKIIGNRVARSRNMAAWNIGIAPANKTKAQIASTCPK